MVYKPLKFSYLTLLQLRHFSRKLLWRAKPVNCLLGLLTQMCTQGHFWLVFFYCHFDHPEQYQTMLLPVNNGRLILTCKCTLLHIRFDSVWLLSALHVDIQCTLASIFWLILTLAVVGGLSALDIPWQVYQQFLLILTLAVVGGLSALDIHVSWEVYQHFDWFWPLQ